MHTRIKECDNWQGTAYVCSLHSEISLRNAFVSVVPSFFFFFRWFVFRYGVSLLQKRTQIVWKGLGNSVELCACEGMHSYDSSFFTPSYCTMCVAMKSTILFSSPKSKVFLITSRILVYFKSFQGPTCLHCPVSPKSYVAGWVPHAHTRVIFSNDPTVHDHQCGWLWQSIKWLISCYPFVFTTRVWCSWVPPNPAVSDCWSTDYKIMTLLAYTVESVYK
jgi:hypothetical protein